MGWITDLFEGFNLTPELIAKLVSIESQLAVLEPENVQLRIETDRLREQIAEVEREKEQFQRENEDLRKTREFPQTNLHDLEPLDDNKASLLKALNRGIMPAKDLTSMLPDKTHEAKAKQIAFLHEHGYIEIDPIGTPERRCKITEKGERYLDEYFLR